jgi:hypothetical protein
MHQGRSEALACALGFFSIGLGVAEIVAPRLFARAADARVSDGVIRLCGAREIANGVGILLAWKRGPWLWARVAGDAIDIAATRRPAALAALAGVTALDIAAAAAVSREENRPPPRRFDYSDRSGFPRPAAEMRGVARAGGAATGATAAGPARPTAHTR